MEDWNTRTRWAVNVTVLVAAFTLLLACLPSVSRAQSLGDIINSLARVLGGAAQPNSPVTVLLFGGKDHGTFLGCLSCASTDRESVFNEFGTHGSAFARESVRNRFSDFGSPFSQYSACNPIADDPPVVVDTNGRYYGRLTMNPTRTDIVASAELISWLVAQCQKDEP